MHFQEKIFVQCFSLLGMDLKDTPDAMLEARRTNVPRYIHELGHHHHQCAI
jgi:hypothetical protein